MIVLKVTELIQTDRFLKEAITISAIVKTHFPYGENEWLYY